MIRSTNIRFNLDKPLHREAWRILQTMDKARFRSYSNLIILALVYYMERQERLKADPYLETREREERFITQMVEAVERAMEKSLPVFLSGCAAGWMTGNTASQATAMPSTPDAVPEADVDWDFLGG